MARILVVEDDSGQLEVRRLILEQSGHEVVTAQTAAEALDRLPGCQIVLMDLQLPTREDGRRLILATSGAARIVVLSGAEPEEMPPVDAFLNKPCSSRKLLETIARFCLLLVCLSVLRGATVNVSRAQSEVVAGLDLRAPGTDWGQPGKEAALATVFVDARTQQQIMLYAGARQFTYTVFLGALPAGQRSVDVRGPGVEFLGACFCEDASDVLANAPVLYARANTVKNTQISGSLCNAKRLSENGAPFLQYTVISRMKTEALQPEP
jgi:CheY-like chemotaxis protein